MSLAAIIRELIAAGVTGEALVAAVERIEAATPVPSNRTARQERNHRYYERKASEKRLKPSETSNSDAHPFPLSSPPCSSPKPLTKTPPIIPQSSDIYRATERDFSLFWSVYPSKVGKDDARKAFARAVSRIAGPDPPAVMVAAVELAKSSQRWIDGFVPNPATWLNQGRWQDDIIPAVERKAKGDQESFAERDTRHRRENLERSYAASERVVDLARRRRGEITDSEPTDAFG